jgi:NTP pyrophosphatase (non-canonical NTP hydrolase)
MAEDEVDAALRGFVSERDWDQFHSPENLAKSIVIEAAELLECFQWQTGPARETVASELADVLTYCRLPAAKLDLDADQIVLDKLNTTRAEYRSRRRAARVQSMTSFRIEKVKLTKGELVSFSQRDPNHRDWPVVYTLDDASEVYVGESLDAVGRLRQHLDGGKKSHLGEARVIVDTTFNKSACLDLESYLIGLFSGEGRFKVLNVQASSGTGNYYQRDSYRERFHEVFTRLRSEGLFSTSIEEIENSDLYKLSPFKSLTDDQGDAVVAITEGLLSALDGGPGGSMVIEGGPGTGKTVVAIFLTKLLRDIGAWDGEPLESESYVTGLFTTDNKATLADLRIGLVVPQQSLRKSIQAVFSRTPGLNASIGGLAVRRGEELPHVGPAHRRRGPPAEPASEPDFGAEES